MDQNYAMQLMNNNLLVLTPNNRKNPIQFNTNYWNNLDYVNVSKNVSSHINQNNSFGNGLNPQFNLSPPNNIANGINGQSNVPSSIYGNPLNLSSNGAFPFNVPLPVNGVGATSLSYSTVNGDNIDLSLPSPSIINENNGSFLPESDNLRNPVTNMINLSNNDREISILETDSSNYLFAFEDLNMNSLNKIDNDGIKDISSSSSNVNMKEMEFSTKGVMTDERKSPSLTDTANIVQGNKHNNTKSTKKAYIHAIIVIKFWNMGRIKLNMNRNYRLTDKSPNPHKICYFVPREIPKVTKNGNGIINVCIDLNDLLKIFPGLKDMKVHYENQKIEDMVYDIEKDGSKSNQIIVPMNTFKVNKPITLSFRDENNERFKISIKLEDTSTTRRRFKNKNKGKNSEDKDEKSNNEKRKSKNVENCMKLEIINGFIEEIRKVSEEFLDISIRFGLKEMCKTLDMAINKEIFKKEDSNNVMNAINEFLKNPKKETHEKLKYIIFNFVKDEEKKNELSILCFNSLYKFIYNIDDSVDIFVANHFNKEIYKKFLKNYFNGQYRENNIIITMDDITIDAMETKSHGINNCDSEDCKRGYDSISENEDHQRKKQQKVDKSGNIFRLTDK